MDKKLLKWADRKKDVFCTTGTRTLLGLDDDGSMSLVPNLDLDGDSSFEELRGWTSITAEAPRSRPDRFLKGSSSSDYPTDSEQWRDALPQNQQSGYGR